MSIDFSALVLGPCMDTFARPLTVYPVASQPTAPQYANRGIWIIDQVPFVGEDGILMSTRTVKMGIMLVDYPVPPQQYDFISVAVADLPMGYKTDTLNPNKPVDFVIDDVNPDGQGGAHLTLKRKPR